MILFVVSYERENIFFYEKNFKLTENNNPNNIFCNQIFSFYRFLLIFKIYWIFMNHGLFFSRRISSTL